MKFKSYKKFLKPGSKQEEGGAMIIMGFLSILAFLYFAVLILDVPYMERIGRSMQRSVDTAALAGTVQLMLKNAQDCTPMPCVRDQGERLRGWRNAKRAVFAFLRLNPVTAIESLNISLTPTAPGTNEDPLDLATGYGYENYTLSGSGGVTANLTISRGVYHRPNNWVGGPITTFYKTEREDGNNSDNWQNVEAAVPPLNPDSIRCVTIASPDSPIHEYPVGTQHPLEPTECLTSAGSIIPGQPVIDVADSVQVTLTINNVPSLFARLLGFDSFTSITRTATASPL